MEANKVLLQKMYTKIIIEFSQQTEKSVEDSMDYFYKSTTYDLVRDGISDMHCRGYKYLADELMLEYGFKKHKGYIN
ncbi:hypothetical protein QOZ83_01310 [Romboutsia sedimentorum]|uniref:hypothetical protein n=1 Tax=Romboutsia sedimentorum TaxID=1368474 RepID=UPI0024DE841D|nr:hypothetical protein [Romboutsia sedimentorum]MDK2584484.1 hypothetical protein [Romboutsia sedimentorum]